MRVGVRAKPACERRKNCALAAAPDAGRPDSQNSGLMSDRPLSACPPTRALQGDARFVKNAEETAMSRTARGLELALVAVTLTLASCRGDRSTRPSDATSSAGPKAWAKSSATRFARSAREGTSLELRPLGEAADIAPARSLSAAAPGDSTNDICEAAEWCGIQGGLAGGLVGVQCLDGPGLCGTAAYSWSIRNPPPNSTTTFTPNPQEVDLPAELLIQTTDSTPPGLYQSTLVIAAVGSSPPPDPDTIPITVHVLCNFRLQTCPELEIVDLVKDSVVSAPKPRQDTFIGRPMKLRMRQKAGTGTGQYTVIGSRWILFGDQAMVKSYDITTGTLTPLTGGDDLTSISYYYVISNNSGEYPIVAEATLRRNDGAISVPRTTARYRAAGPSNIAMTTKTTTDGTTVGWWNPNVLALKFGDEAIAKVGIIFSFLATMPSGDNGYLSATQLVNTAGDYVLAPGASPPLPQPPYNSNGTYWLDSCPLYGPAAPASMFGPTIWAGIDSPYQRLTSQLSVMSRSDAFKMFFMYRPSGPQSIWVPLGNVSWHWKGKTVRTNFNTDDILLRDGWTNPTETDWSVNPMGQASSVFPEWTTAIPYDQSECAPIPTQ